MTPAALTDAPTDALLHQIIAASQAGRPLSSKDLLAHDPADVRRLIDSELVERRPRRIAGTEITVILPTDMAINGRPDDEGWGEKELAYLAEAYPAGVRWAEMAARLDRSGGTILTKAVALGHRRPGFLQPGHRQRRRRGHVDGFGSEVPAWRIRRLRMLLIDAEMRGINPDDAGDELVHRALRRRYDTGRRRVDPTVRRHAKWTDDDIATLHRMRAENKTTETIATTLQRTWSGVATKITDLGLAIDVTWTEDEDRLLMVGIENGLTNDEVADQLPNRTGLAVKQRSRHLLGPRGPKMWTQEERDQVIETYQIGGNTAELARQLGRSRSALTWQAQQMGLKHPKAINPYTPAEIARLTELYRQGVSPRTIAVELGRPWRSVATQASKIGVTGQLRRRITAKEIETIRSLAGELPAGAIGARIGRTRQATFRIATRHGISLRVNRGSGTPI